mmetsp:Transcript_3426/g.7546  ORF Transcript_3426/g.7546 Transcript_3426/m.7546 type:complete len:279 (+) Transcript_3426:242-1078(+)
MNDSSSPFIAMLSNFKFPFRSITSPSPSAAETASLIARIDREQGSCSIGSTTSLIVASKAVSPSSATASAYDAPARASSSPYTHSPNRSMRSARRLPTFLTSLLPPPQPIDAPLLAWTNCILALRDNTTRSVHVCNSAPPPTAYPSTALIERTGREMSWFVTLVICSIMLAPSLSLLQLFSSSSSASSCLLSCRSSPEQKAPLSPVNITTRASFSSLWLLSNFSLSRQAVSLRPLLVPPLDHFDKVDTCRSNCSIMETVNAFFRLGLLSVRTATLLFS